MSDKKTKTVKASKSSSTSSRAKNMIKDYKITGIVGEGGMGKVYKAIHPTLKRDIIIKELKIRDKETRERFLREAEIMLDFRHENIVQFYDHFKAGTSHYIAMEYVNGDSLNNVIQHNEKIPVHLALFILYQAALGLHHAHTKKVIHRDIKPHNILISESGDIKIIDFGIARQKNDNREGLTQPGTVIGTPAYMSPEQFSTKQDITYQTDIYSLGVVFYEMITGKRPYKNEFSSDVIEAITKGKYTPATKYIKSLPSIARKVIRKTFNPDYKKRYKTLYPLIKVLRSYFKKYNSYEIKASIKLLLRGEKDIKKYPFYKSYKECRIKRKKFVYKALVAVFLVFILYLFISTNRYYEWIRRGSYGKVTLMFKKANMDEDKILINIKRLDNPVKKKFFVDEKRTWNERADFKSDEQIYEKDYYLPAGEYEFKIIAGSYKTSRRANILPISMQSKTSLLNTRKDAQRIIYVPIENQRPKAVHVEFKFWNVLEPHILLFEFNNYTEYDDISLKTEEPELMMWDDAVKKDVPVKDYVFRRLRYSNNAPFMSGKLYSFLVRDFSKGNVAYELKKFNFQLELDDSSRFAHIPLTPTPARVVVVSDSKKVPIEINGNDYGYIFENGQYSVKKYRDVKAVQSKNVYVTQFFIPPGNVQVKFGKSDKILTDELGSRKRLNVRLKRIDGEYKY